MSGGRRHISFRINNRPTIFTKKTKKIEHSKTVKTPKKIDPPILGAHSININSISIHYHDKNSLQWLEINKNDWILKQIKKTELLV